MTMQIPTVCGSPAHALNRRAFLGGVGGRIKGGRVHGYIQKPNRQICRLYMSMMDKMGARVDSFGDAKEALQEI
jgi:hypothetical protein